MKYRGEGKGRRGAITSFEGEIRVESNTSLVIRRTFGDYRKKLQKAVHHEGNPLIFLAK